MHVESHMAVFPWKTYLCLLLAHSTQLTPCFISVLTAHTAFVWIIQYWYFAFLNDRKPFPLSLQASLKTGREFPGTIIWPVLLKRKRLLPMGRIYTRVFVPVTKFLEHVEGLWLWSHVPHDSGASADQALPSAGLARLQHLWASLPPRLTRRVFGLLASPPFGSAAQLLVSPGHHGYYFHGVSKVRFPN